MKQKIMIFVLVLAATLSLLCGCASWERAKKTVSSDISGGVQRTLTVYDYNGQEIRSWTGKMDVSNENERTMFDLDGKRTIIRGGIIVIQED